MKVIYVMENKVNGKKYIGQTNNFNLRMNGHRSDANNQKSHSYNSPLSYAIRKYGWENFNNYIIEELPEEASYEEVDERERFFIEHFQSLSSQNGYNITAGGQNGSKPKLTYEEKIEKSKLFTKEEIQDIQFMLRNNIPTRRIMIKYNTRLTRSFLDNINAGLNFKNDNWKYPLRDTTSLTSINYSPEEQEEIRKEIVSGTAYREIAEKWDISLGHISAINNGSRWFDERYEYPLCEKTHSRLHASRTWVKLIQNDLMNSKLNLVDIAKKYDKAYSTIKKINSGSSHRNSEYNYPLTSNRT